MSLGIQLAAQAVAGVELSVLFTTTEWPTIYNSTNYQVNCHMFVQMKKKIVVSLPTYTIHKIKMNQEPIILFIDSYT